MIGVVFSNCQKEVKTEYVLPDSTYTDRLQFVLKYNPTQFGNFYNILVNHDLADELSTPGPFTVFVPNNDALIYTTDMPDIAHYIFSGGFTLGQLKPGDETTLHGSDGYKLSCRAYSYGNGVRYTANGVLLQVADETASNGYIHVLNGQIPAITYPTCLSCVDGIPAFTTFAYALKRSHLDVLLKDSASVYSVLAPTNDAFLAAGIDIDSVSRQDPDSLAAIIKYHILKGRFYSYDIISQYKGDGINVDTLRIPTLADSPMRVVIYTNGSQDPKDYGFQFVGSNGATSGQGLYQAPYPAGSGVVRYIDLFLKP